MATDETMMASVAGRYASALFDLAAEQNQSKAVEADLIALQALLDSSPDLTRLVRSPIFSADEQSGALGAVLAKAGVSPLTTNFFKLVAKNRRLFQTSDIIKAFRTLAARGRGETQAEVTSAVALNDAQLRQLEDTLKASVGGRNIQITSRVDPGLLGGLIVKVGSRMVDGSLRTKLNNLKTAMKEVG